jgi:CBS-domain-containing membrane protein
MAVIRPQTPAGLLVIAPEDASLGDLMTSPVVTADQDCPRGDLVAMLAKYQFRMLPVVEAHDYLLGIVRYKDMMTNSPPPAAKHAGIHRPSGGNPPCD